MPTREPPARCQTRQSMEGCGRIVALAALLACGAAPAPARAAAPPPSAFMIGVFQQPPYTFTDWRARGVDTIVGLELLSGTVPYSTWRRALDTYGFRAIRPPHGDPRRDAADP